MATETKNKNSGKKIVTTTRATKTVANENETLPSSDASLGVEAEAEAEAQTEAPSVNYTDEQLAEQKELLEKGIALGIQWFEDGRDGETFAGFSRKEQAFTRLLDPMLWLMREALVTFQHEDCEECEVRRRTGGNGLSLAIAEMMLQDGAEEEASGGTPEEAS